MTEIPASQTGTVVATSTGHWVVETGVTVSITGPGIDASGDATGRGFLVKGSLSSVYGPAITLGDEGGIADSQTTITVDYQGLLRSGGTGLLAYFGGVTVEVTGDDVNGAGTLEASALALDLRQGGNTIRNDGAIRSTANTAIVSAGALDSIMNTGAIAGHLHGVVTSGDGMAITSSGEIAASRGYGIISSGADLIITNSGTISARKDAVLASGDGATVTNSAVITSSKGAGIAVSGNGAVITSTTRIVGETYGISASGEDAAVDNFGTIRAAGTGIQVTGDGSTVNTTAHLKGSVGLVLGGDGSIATNTNVIEGTSKTAAAVRLADDSDFTNLTGEVKARSGHAIAAGGGDNAVVNAAALHGDVRLGGGTDFFSALVGQVDGKVYGGKGNDIYEAGIKLDIVEKAGQGTDTVKAIFSWTLGANIENLELIGDAAADARGNKLDNLLTGNSSDNAFRGLGGRDIFVMRTGGGTDRIMDFEDRADLIDFRHVDGIDGFADIRSHMTQSGKDVVIDLLDEDAGMMLILRKTDIHDLGTRDVLF